MSPVVWLNNGNGGYDIYHCNSKIHEKKASTIPEREDNMGK